MLEKGYEDTFFLFCLSSAIDAVSVTRVLVYLHMIIYRPINVKQGTTYEA